MFTYVSPVNDWQWVSWR